MAFRIREFTLSRSGTLGKDSQTRELIMIGDGTSDDAVAKAGFALFAPPIFDGLYLSDMKYETMGGLLWKATAYYTPNAAPIFPAVGMVGPPTPVDDLPGLNDPLPAWIDFDFTGVVEHITQSKNTIHRIQRGTGGIADSAPNNQKAIGVTKDGRVEGCDKISPNLELVMTVTFSSVSSAYVEQISDMVGTTNNATWFGRPAKSLIFLGGTTQTKDTFKKVVTFKFLRRPNLENIVICDDLVIPTKKGSEYLWVSYKNAKDGKMIMQPDAAYVEEICDATDFENLRIGK